MIKDDYTDTNYLKKMNIRTYIEMIMFRIFIKMYSIIYYYNDLYLICIYEIKEF